MVTDFLAHMRIVPDHRIPGMVTYPLDEILLTTLVGVVCGADDWDGVEEVATGALDWLRSYLPFENGVATAQTLRKVFRLLDPKALERGFASWAASVRPLAREVVAVDGKTLRGSRQADGAGALHLVSAYATGAGLVLAQRAVNGKSNEITAIPSSRAWSWADVSCRVPSVIFGQRNSPSSSRFATSTTPVPSQNTSFTRSARLARNTYTVPENGSAPMVSRTKAASPSAPLRKSTGRVATMTRTAPVGPITACPSARRSPPRWWPARPRSRSSP